MAGKFQAFEYGRLIHQDAVASQDRVVAAHTMGHERANSAYRAHCRLVVLRNRSAFCHVADDEGHMLRHGQSITHGGAAGIDEDQLPLDCMAALVKVLIKLSDIA